MKTTVVKTKNSRPSQKTLELEAYIRYLMRIENVINAAGPVVCAVLVLLSIVAFMTPLPQWMGVGDAIGMVALPLFLLQSAVIAWLLVGWFYLIKISKALQELPTDRSSTMKEVVGHLHPTIYLFGVANIIALLVLFLPQLPGY